MKGRRWWTVMTVLLILAILAWRIPALWIRPLWIDEAFTWRDSAEGILSMMSWTNSGHHPPMSYLLAYLSYSIFGLDHEWPLRLPSFLAWLLCIPAAYWVGRRCHSHAAGLWLSLFIVLDPVISTQGLQARMWSMAVLMTLLTVGWTHRLLADTHRPYWAWSVWGAVLAGGFWASAIGPLMGVAAVLAALIWLLTELVRREPVSGTRWLGFVWALVLAAVVSQMGLLDVYLSVTQSTADNPEAISHSVSIASAAWSMLTSPDKFMHVPYVSAGLLLAGMVGLGWLCARSGLAGLIWWLVWAANTVGLTVFLTKHHSLESRYLLAASLSSWFGVIVLGLELKKRLDERVGWLLVPAAFAALTVACITWQQRHDEVGLVLRDLRSEIEPGDVVLMHPDWLNWLQKYYVPDSEDPAFYEWVLQEQQDGQSDIQLPDRVWLVGGYIYDQPPTPMLIEWADGFDSLRSSLKQVYSQSEMVGPYQDDRSRAILFSSPKRTAETE